MPLVSGVLFTLRLVNCIYN